MPALPAESEIKGWAQRFAAAERRIRSLIGRAPDGGRRELLSQALAIFVALERDTGAARLHAEATYLISYLATLGLLGRDVAAIPEPTARASRLAAGLEQRLATGVRTARMNATLAIGSATAETLPVLARQGLTAYVDAAGRQIPLGAYADLQVSTVARHVVSEGLEDVLVGNGEPMVSIEGGGGDEVCDFWIEQESVHAQGPLPPYHPHCQCAAVPLGSTTGEQIAVLQEKRNRVYREWWARKHEAKLAAAAAA